MQRFEATTTIKRFWSSGEHWLWLNAGSIAIALMMVFFVIGFIAYKGLSHFWPDNVVMLDYGDKQSGSRTIIGEVFAVDINKDSQQEEWLIKTANRDRGLDFVWIKRDKVRSLTYPKDIIYLERQEWGPALGRFTGIVTPSGMQRADYAWLDAELQRVRSINAQIKAIQARDVHSINAKLEEIRLHAKRLELEGKLDDKANEALELEKATLTKQYQKYAGQIEALYAQLAGNQITIRLADDSTMSIPTDMLIAYHLPNQMGLFAKCAHFVAQIGRFISEDPREANTEGGVFPSIFGTIMMVFLMTIIVMPLGVITAVYLHEYAKDGWLIRLVRISVNNLAGVPSIVYGVFGLGFFVYFLGGNIDALFYPEALPAPTFGTPGILWAALTMALLTLPVVIVATEEGLTRIPRAIREGSLALGATKFETLWRVILPMSSPAMMTGLILAIARAAGEVAPLMLVGVVKLAPNLPVDSDAPFFHLERKFMHLGFHIYDVGFQSPNVEAARPLVYATALLLVVVIILLNLTAVKIRNDLRERYKAIES